MGLYEGGLLMSLLFITTIAFFYSSGVLAQTNPGAIHALACVPNTGNITQYVGLDSNTLSTSNCISDVNASGVNVSSTQNDDNGVITAVLKLFGGSVLGQLAQLITLFILGWIVILQIILGNSFLIFLIGVPLQLLQIYFIVQVALQIISALRGQGSPR